MKPSLQSLLLLFLNPFTGFMARWLTPARHFFLAEGDTSGRVRFLSLPIELAEGMKTSWVTVTRTGTFTDPRYGQFDITPAMLAQMVSNFDARVLGQDVFFDVAHKPNDGAAARVLKLAVEGNRLRALVEWTPFGIEAVKTRGFAYLSAEFHESWRDNEQGNAHGCVLLGAALTTRPVIKHLDRVQLSEDDDNDDDSSKLAIHPNLRKHLEQDDMNYLEQLRAKLLSQGLTEDQIKPILAAAEKQLAESANDQAKSLAVVESFTSAGAALAAHLKTLSGASGGPITLQVGNGLDATAVQREVQRVLSEQAAAAAASTAQHQSRVKLLSDTVNAETGLSEDTKALLLAEITPLITRELSEEQVKSLAAFAIKQATSNSAAAQLALLGYNPPGGSLRISVDSSNQVKSLQEQVDRRLGISSTSDRDRYIHTGGVLLARNKEFAEKCLAQFDVQHGHRLAEEHKMLSGGTGVIADSAVPAVFERTVLREALYQLNGLSFVDVGTAALAPVLQIPYSYRDNSAAGIANTRSYEMQAIQRGGVIQTYDEARPIPQKLAFKLSNEMRYLLAAAPIDFDPLAENVRNIIRITAEDTDRIIQNEVLNSADEALVGSLNDTLTAQVNGSNRVFVTTQFPLVRPRRFFDLKGVQVGSIVNPMVVTLNGTVRSEYVPGVALSAGLYYVCDYNLGEIRFVNESGVLQTPTSGWALTVVGSYTQNVSKVNIDIGTAPDTVNDVYDRALTLIGGRKVVIENDRNYTANMLLMSGAIDNALGQAKTFTANSSRPGTGLNPDGSIAIVKGIPAFNTRAPGLNTGDVRIVVGQSANTRFRMLRPFQMKDIQEARDNNGFFVGAGESYGEQFIACHTPTMRKNANTSLVLYSASGRVARAA